MNLNLWKEWSSFYQGRFISEMEWASFKCLFWNANGSVVKLMISVTSEVSLWYIPCHENMLNYDNDINYWKLTTIKNLVFFIAEGILAFASSTDLEKLEKLRIYHQTWNEFHNNIFIYNNLICLFICKWQQISTQQQDI